MADYRYAYNGPEEGVAKAMLKDVAISSKAAIEISKYLKGRTTEKAKRILELVLKKEHAIPYTRFTDGVGHKSGQLAAGRYPQKAAEQFLAMINLVEANAAQKGLGEPLVIIHLLAHKASSPWHFGRQRRRKMKRTHLEIAVKEDEGAKKSKKAAKKKPAKAEAQATVKKPAPKAEAKEKVATPKKVASSKAEDKKEEKTSAPKKEVQSPEPKKVAPKAETKPAEKEPEVKKEAKPAEKSSESKPEKKPEAQQ